jgi:photosynthetic reaction center H subunit
MAKDILETEDGVRIAPLSALSDFQVAEGYTDIRGWRVASTDGKEVGQVHELLVDMDSMRTRYLDVRLHSSLAAADGDRDVLIPIGAARLDGKDNQVVVPLTAERVSLLPPYDHKHLLRTHESEIRRHFALGEVAAGTAAAAAGKGFYDSEVYDDRRFFTKQPAADAMPAAETVTRIPVDDGDTVSLKRGEDGRDEIIVRRPRA